MLDSNYGKNDWNKNIEGSTAYLFKELAESDDNGFIELINRIVEKIDSVNSTHLEATKDGRKIIADRIVGFCNNYEGLKEKLEQPFYEFRQNHIIAKIADGIPEKNDKEKRYNISFATKFCSYAADFIGTKIQYPKYDKVVCSVLPIYESYYLGQKNKYYINYTAPNKLDERLKKYADYWNAIKTILEKVNQNKEEKVTIKEFDHIVWYTNKGR